MSDHEISKELFGYLNIQRGKAAVNSTDVSEVAK